MSEVVLEGLRLLYGKKPAVDGVSLTLPSGSLTALLGPSGCGKTSLLRLVAGFAAPAAGTITIDGALVASPDHTTPAEERRTGMVFQNASLFPHLTVARNIGFGLRHLRSQARKEKVAALMERLRLTDKASAYPHTLSGGEAQRVALARALAPEPRILLLDEPFASLDAPLRFATREETRALIAETGTTSLLVTHDPEEACQFAATLALMHEGKLVQVGTPDAVYHTPVSPAAAAMLAPVNTFETVAEQEILRMGELTFPTQTPAGAVTVVIRPEDFTPSATGLPLATPKVRLLGTTTLLKAENPLCPGVPLTARLPTYTLPTPVPPDLRLAPVRVHVFPRLPST